MSGRHRVRLLEEKQYMCSARGCKFKGTYDEGVAHINVENRKRDAVIPPGMTEVKDEGATVVWDYDAGTITITDGPLKVGTDAA